MERTADRKGSLPFDRSRLIESVLVLPGFISLFSVLALFTRFFGQPLSNSGI
jgi:hypothetical protein